MRDEVRHRKPMWRWCNYCLRAEALEYDDVGPRHYPCADCHGPTELVTPKELAALRYAATHPLPLPAPATETTLLRDGPGGPGPNSSTEARLGSVWSSPLQHGSRPADENTATSPAEFERPSPQHPDVVGAHVTSRSRRAAPQLPAGQPGPWCEISEAEALLGCGRTKIFALIRAGKLNVVPEAPGRRTVVTRSSVAGYQEKLSRRPNKRTPADRARQPQPTVPDRDTLARNLAEQRRRLLR